MWLGVLALGPFLELSPDCFWCTVRRWASPFTSLSLSGAICIMELEKIDRGDTEPSAQCLRPWACPRNAAFWAIPPKGWRKQFTNQLAWVLFLHLVPEAFLSATSITDLESFPRLSRSHSRFFHLESFTLYPLISQWLTISNENGSPEKRC